MENDYLKRLRALSIQRNQPVKIAETPTPQVSVPTTPQVVSTPTYTGARPSTFVTPTVKAPSVGPKYSSAFSAITDILNANSPQDIAKRVAAGQPAGYREQQIAMGNTRPSQNIGQALFREPLTFAGTQGALARIGGVEAPRLAIAKLTGNKPAEQAARQRIEAITTGQDKRFNAFGVPTAFGQKALGEDTGISSAAKRFGGSVLGTAAFAVGGGELPALTTLGKAGMKEAGKFVLKEGLAAAMQNVGSELVQKPNASAQELAKAGATGFAIGVPLAVAGAGVSRGISQALESRAGRILATKIAESTDDTLIKQTVRDLLPNIAEEDLNTLSKRLAATTDPVEVTNILKEANIGVTAPTATAPTAVATAVDNTAQQLAKTTDVNAVKEAVQALYPKLDSKSQTDFANVIAKSNDINTIKQVLQQADTRSKALTESIQQVTPTTPTVAQTQAEAAAKLVEQPPVRVETPAPVTRVLETPTPRAIAEPIQTRQLVNEAKNYNTPEEFIAAKTNAYHGSTTENIDKLQPGAALSKNEKRNLIYLAEDKNIAANYAKVRGEGGTGLGELKYSPTGTVYSVNVSGNILDAYDRNALDALTNVPGFKELPGKIQNMITNPTGLSAQILEANPELVKFLRDNGITAVRAFSPNVGTELIVVNPNNVLTAGELRNLFTESRSVQVPTPTLAATEVPQQPNLSQVLYQTPNPTPEQALSVFQRISPNRIAREYVTTPIQNYVNKLIGAAQVSGIAPVRFLGRVSTGVSRELGVTPELLAAKKMFLQGTAELGKITREDIIKLGTGIEDTVNQRVWATLDPELAKAKGIKISVNDLTPEEAAYRTELVKVRDALTQGNAQRGLITDEQAAANWLKRGYKLFDFAPEEGQAYQATKTGMLKQFKGRKDINENLLEQVITDPSYLLAKKSADSHAAWAMVDYSNWLANNGYVSDVARPGFRQLPSNKLYGAAAGKFVPTNIAEDFTGFQYSHGVLNAFNDILSWYDNLKLRKAKKATLTVLNPAVRLGNEVSNRAIFSQLAGINPVTFNVNFAKVAKLKASRDPLYIEAVRRGLTGLDQTQRDFANKVAEYMGEPNQAAKAWNWAKNSYSNADDNARLAAFKTFVDRGYGYDEAARLTQRAFQDYKSVGYFYDIAAKVPVVGNAFARFAGDAARILTNRLVDQPFTLAGSVAGIWALGEFMSRKSGESAQDKAAREGRFGAPKVPFTNISLEIQTPFGAVNAARFMPFYNLNEISGNLTKFLPIAGNPLDPKNWQDPLLGQVMQVITDKDFRGKSIKEPANLGQFRTPTDNKTAIENRLRFVVAQNAPLGREIDSLVSAAKGQADIYGGMRDIKQAVGRAFGLKIEKFGPAEIEKMKANESFFNDKKFIDDQLATLPKDSQEKYKKLTGYYKLRDKIADVFNPGKMRYKKEPVFGFSEDKYKELSTDPKLYDLLMQQKVRDNQRDGKPIPPEFDIRLSNEFRKQLIENKSLRPGEDLEADQRMYSNPEWDKYQQIKNEYTNANKKFYPQTSGEFNDELVKHQNAQFPSKPEAYKAYTDAYTLFSQGKGPKPTFNDAVKAGKDQYEQSKLDWVNSERKARGMAPISPDVWNNVTFGFTSDEKKVYNELRYGKGLGGFGFGSSSSPEYKAALEAIKQLGITVKPLSIVSAAPKQVRLKKVATPSTRISKRIRL